MTDTASLGLEDRTARVIAGQRVWDELTPLLASRSCTLLAAIAYVGSHGGELIKLERARPSSSMRAFRRCGQGRPTRAYSLSGSGGRA